MIKSSLPILLHPVKRLTPRSNQWCGPAILSILSGLDTSDTARILREVSGQRTIRGACPHHLFMGLAELGFRITHDPILFEIEDELGMHPTLSAYFSLSRERRGDKVMVLVTGDHWAIIMGDWYICGITKKAIPFNKAPHRRARVTHAYWVEKIRD